MKEFYKSLKQNISNGLRPDDRLPRNSPYLIDCQNMRPDILPGGHKALTVYSPLSDPFASGYLAGLGISYSFPTPQIFKGREKTLLANATTIYEVTEAANWTLSPMTSYDAYDIGSTKAITSGSSWHIADFGPVYALFNGSCIVFKHNKEGMFGGTNKLLTVDDITVQSGCDFRGRLVMGGFSTTDFYNDAWENFYRELFDMGFGMKFPSMPGSNFVWWSPIGSHGFWIIYPSESLLGLVDDDDNEPYSWDKSALWEILERGEMGFMPMNWQGNVLCVKPLGKGLMIYGDNGVSYMPMTNVEGVSTFGLIDMLPYGVESRSAVGSNINNTEHVFITEDGWLWRVEEGKKPERLGYREWFENMLGNDIVISYDPIEGDYYFCDGLLCYVLSKGGLFDVTYLPTSIATSLGGSVWVSSRPGNADDSYALLETDIIDMNLNMMKSLERITLSMTNTSQNVTVAIDWRMKTRDSFSRTGWSKVNYEGEAFFPVNGIEFRIVVRCLDYTTIDIDEVVVHFKTVDKRELRGVYALRTLEK